MMLVTLWILWCCNIDVPSYLWGIGWGSLALTVFYHTTKKK